jgi:hypothetical protein
MKIHPVFHISLLKLYKEDDEFNRPTPPPALIISDNEEEFEVEMILDKKIIGKTSKYLVKWTGYPLYDATWEPLNNLKNAMDKVNSFESRLQWGHCILSGGVCNISRMFSVIFYCIFFL